MLALVMLMAIFSMAAELGLVTKFPRLLKLLENPKRGPIAGVGVSFLLSVALGSVFGAGGLIVMLGGIMSTVLMQPVYALMRAGKWQQALDAVAKARIAYQHHRMQLIKFGHDVYKVGRIVVAVLAVPVVIVIKTIAILAVISDFLVDPKAGIAKLRNRR